MNSELEDVSDKLDLLTLRLLELMEEKISITLQFENQMKEGHIELAKARYIRGKESVGLIQVPHDTPISSLFDLELSYDKQHENEDENQFNNLHFDIHMNNNEDHDTTYQNPVRWFGVLVPQSLKTSQKRFQECLYLAVKIANIGAKMDRTQKDLHSIMKIKMELLTNYEE